MSEATVVDARLDKLEQDNRRLKLTVGALLLVMAAVPLVGAVMPEQIPEVIQARRFEVIDENGTIRAGMGADGIGYADENGTLRAGMNDLGIFYFDGSSLNYGISYYDENLKLVWSTSCTPNC